MQSNIEGGDLFTTVLVNPFSIFMTHQQNYANDRLGSHTFLNLAKFLKCWTNLRLRFIPPTEMAQQYFDRFPHEKRLLYTNPCADSRHQKMLPVNSTLCREGNGAARLPNLIILGPQKTGTSALSLFLSIHPNVATNMPIDGSFEELQFFGGTNYHRGMWNIPRILPNSAKYRPLGLGPEWYREKFPALSGNGESMDKQVIFEKSANYFDSTEAPAAVHALLPDAKLVVILIDPVDRAYSWYQVGY